MGDTDWQEISSLTFFSTLSSVAHELNAAILVATNPSLHVIILFSVVKFVAVPS